MPLALRGASIRLQRYLRKSNAQYLKRTFERFKQLDLTLEGIVSDMTNDVAPFGTYDAEKMARVERKWATRINTAVDNVYFPSARESEREPFGAYELTFQFWKRELARLLPVKWQGPENSDTVEFSPESVNYLDPERKRLLLGFWEPDKSFRGDPRPNEPVTEAVDPVNLVLGPTSDFGSKSGFLDYSSKRFKAGASAQVRIKTLSNQHKALLFKNYSTAIERGAGAYWTRDEFMSQMRKQLKDPAIRKQMSSNVLRIVRTEYGAASNFVTSQFAEANSHVVRELERVADGRPCLACVALDGTRYPVGSVMDDHPNGMCTFAPVLKTLEEMGYAEDEIPDKYQSAWAEQEREYPTLSSRFYQLPEAEQIKVFPSRELYDLWKEHQFPLQNLAVKRQGMFVPAKAAEVKAELEKYGSALHKRAPIDATSTPWFQREIGGGQDYWKRVDPIDRVNDDVIFMDMTSAQKNFGQYVDGDYPGLNKLDPSPNFKDLPADLQKKFAQRYGKFTTLDELPWSQYNEAMRDLGSIVRKPRACKLLTAARFLEKEIVEFTTGCGVKKYVVLNNEEWKLLSQMSKAKQMSVLNKVHKMQQTMAQLEGKELVFTAPTQKLGQKAVKKAATQKGVPPPAEAPPVPQAPIQKTGPSKFKEGEFKGFRDPEKGQLWTKTLEELGDDDFGILSPNIIPWEPADSKEQLTKNIINSLRAGTNPQPLNRAATAMAKLIPEDAILVPLPSSSGSTAANQTLAKLIAQKNGSKLIQVQDILGGESTLSSALLHKKGLPGLFPEDLTLYLKHPLKKSDLARVVFVDNSAFTGNKIEAARMALGYNSRAVVWARAENLTHRAAVEFALKQGVEVPAHVLKAYPDLMKGLGKAPPKGVVKPKATKAEPAPTPKTPEVPQAKPVPEPELPPIEVPKPARNYMQLHSEDLAPEAVAIPMGDGIVENQLVQVRKFRTKADYRGLSSEFKGAKDLYTFEFKVLEEHHENVVLDLVRRLGFDKRASNFSMTIPQYGTSSTLTQLGVQGGAHFAPMRYDLLGGRASLRVSFVDSSTKSRSFQGLFKIEVVSRDLELEYKELAKAVQEWVTRNVPSLERVFLPVTPAEQALMKLNRLVWSENPEAIASWSKPSMPGSARSLRDPVGARDIKRFDRSQMESIVANRYGIPKSKVPELLDSMKWRQITASHGVWEVPPAFESVSAKAVGKVGQQFRKLQTDLELTHDIHGGLGGMQSVERVVDIFRSGALRSSNERFLSGNFISGMSSGQDFATGGADYVFMRMKMGTGGPSRHVRLVFNQKELRRTDWFGYLSDQYGKTHGAAYTGRVGRTELLSKYAQHRNVSVGMDLAGNELMFRGAVDLTNLKRIDVSTLAQKTRLIELLKKEGITSWNGKPLEKFIEVYR